MTTAPGHAATSAQAVPAITVSITGTIANGGAFTGALDVTRFVNSRGRLLAMGTLTGTLNDAAEAVIGTVSGVPVSLPVAHVGGTCQVLHLDLGPLDLTLLGLHVHLNEVIHDITAQRVGGLLGDLLCAVANRLDGGGPLGSLAGLLTWILAALWPPSPASDGRSVGDTDPPG